MSLLDIIMSVIIELARIVITILYFKTFLDLCGRIRLIWISGLSFLITTMSYLVFNNNVINSLSTIIGIFIIAFAFQGKLKSKVLLSILCYSIMIAIDFIVFFIDIDSNNRYEYKIVISFLSVLLFYAVMMLLKLVFRKKMKTEFMGQWYILFVVSIMSVCVLFVIYKEMTMSAFGILFVSTVVLVMNLLLYVFYSNMLDRFVYVQENENLKQQMNFYEQQLKMNMENDKKIRLIRHDIKHHIREINNLADNGRLEDIKLYTRRLEEDIKDSEIVYNTGNITLDGILNYYHSRFVEKDIKTDINVTVPENMVLWAYDLNIILGNLLDNAFENTVRSKEPYVIVDVKYEGHVLYISVANTYDGKVKKENEMFLSRKGNNHGYGLENIKRIARKYNGDIRIENSRNFFIVGVVMYLETGERV
ncbi:MAG: sensor histidine kinase [Lachnospira sp.]